MADDSGVMAVVLCGVSGCGKSSVGRELAKLLKCDFLEGDDFHPATSIARMAKGRPLTDIERVPWLASIRVQIEQYFARHQSVVVSCSALTPAYRRALRPISPPRCPVFFVLLNPSKDTLLTRLKVRELSGNHFMPASLLDSQLATLAYSDADMLCVVTDDCTPARDVASNLRTLLQSTNNTKFCDA